MRTSFRFGDIIGDLIYCLKLNWIIDWKTASFLSEVKVCKTLSTDHNSTQNLYLFSQNFGIRSEFRSVCASVGSIMNRSIYCEHWCCIRNKKLLYVVIIFICCNTAFFSSNVGYDYILRGSSYLGFPLKKKKQERIWSW